MTWGPFRGRPAHSGLEPLKPSSTQIPCLTRRSGRPSSSSSAPLGNKQRLACPVKELKPDLWDGIGINYITKNAKAAKGDLLYLLGRFFWNRRACVTFSDEFDLRGIGVLLVVRLGLPLCGFGFWVGIIAEGFGF